MHWENSSGTFPLGPPRTRQDLGRRRLSPVPGPLQVCTGLCFHNSQASWGRPSLQLAQGQGQERDPRFTSDSQSTWGDHSSLLPFTQFPQYSPKGPFFSLGTFELLSHSLT